MWWEVLGVSRTASMAVVKSAYKMLARKYHPDRQQNHDNIEHATTMFRKISEAYEQSQKPGATFVGPATHFNPGFGGVNAFWHKAADLTIEMTVTLGQVLRGDQVSEEYVHRRKDGTMAKNRVTVTLGPHMHNKYKVRVREKGNDPPKFRPGDLLIIIIIDPGPYRICSPNLRIRVPMTLYDLLTGVETTVVMPTGEDRLCCPSVQPGDDFGKLEQVFSGEGLARKDGSRGDVVIEFSVKIPDVRPSEYPLLSAALGEKRTRDNDTEPGICQKRSKHLSS